MKDLKDYAHLYIGSQIRILNDVTGKYSRWRKMSASDLSLIMNHNAKTQIELRSLPDMTEDELKECIQSIYFDIFGYNENIGYFQKSTEGNSVGVVAILENEQKERIGFTISIDRGIVFSIDGSELMVDQFKYTKKLLEQKFDLFDLMSEEFVLIKTI